MDWSGLPSLNSLRAFCVVAETGSYSQAASRLNVTPAAVNQQVKALEVRLGVSLVLRSGRSISLTSAGGALARDLAAGFAGIRQGIESLKGADAMRPVQITMSPAFAVEWLMPRITDFQERHPEITLMLNPTAEVVELRPGGIDLAIRYTDRRNPDEIANEILHSDMVIVGAPALVGSREFDHPSDLAGLPWLEELGTDEVRDWFARRRITPDQPLSVSQMPGNLIMQAVRRGDGITYSVRAFFEREIVSGTMKVLFSEPEFGVFYLETAPGAVRPAVETVIGWLKSQSVSAGQPD